MIYKKLSTNNHVTRPPHPIPCRNPDLAPFASHGMEMCDPPILHPTNINVNLYGPGFTQPNGDPDDKHQYTATPSESDNFNWAE